MAGPTHEIVCDLVSERSGIDRLLGLRLCDRYSSGQRQRSEALLNSDQGSRHRHL